jgi:hypothetical protein
LSGFQPALKEARESARDGKYDIPLMFKDTKTSPSQRMLDYENADEPIMNPEVHFGIEYFNVRIN